MAAGVLTVVSGLVAGLVAFVAARVLTGLGEGVFYSNDRTLIINHTPVAKRTLGLGIVIVGLSIGLTVGIIATPLLIEWGASLGMGDEAWRVPFFVFAAFTFVVVAVAFMFFRAKLGGAMRLGRPFLRLLLFSAPTFVVIVALFLLAETFEWPEWLTAPIAGVIAARLHRGHRAQRAEVRPRAGLLNRNMWLIYIAYIAILWNLWFFSFWSVQIVKEAAESSLLAAALTAAFNAGAGHPRVPRRRLAGRLCGPHRAQPQDARPDLHRRLLGPRADLRVERIRRRRHAVARPARAAAVQLAGCSSTPCSRSSRA